MYVSPTYSRAKELAQCNRYQQPSSPRLRKSSLWLVLTPIPNWIQAARNKLESRRPAATSIAD